MKSRMLIKLTSFNAWIRMRLKPNLSSTWFHLSSTIISTTIWIRQGIPHPSIISLPFVVPLYSTINQMCNPPLKCSHSSENIWMHVVLSIFLKFNSHMDLEHYMGIQTSIFYGALTWFFSEIGFTLKDVSIANPTWIDLLPCSCFTWAFVILEATQTKKRSI
jgi:hypothetical protein